MTPGSRSTSAAAGGARGGGALLGLTAVYGPRPRRSIRPATLRDSVSAVALLCGAGAAAVLGLGWPARPAIAGAPPGSPQWVGQQAAAHAAGVPASAANPVATLTPAQLAQMQRSIRNVTRASEALRAQLAGQAAVRAAAALTNPAVPDGLADGGLKVHPGLNQAAGAVWTNAEAPTEQRTDDGDVEVTIRQTASKAILTWDSFNVGAKTTLGFDQRGNRDWVALNRVTDSSSPSRILGKITADGQVYVINTNGILFTGTSQVNVGGLVASSLDIGLPYQSVADRNAYFLANAGGTLSFSSNLKRNPDGTLAGRLYQGSLGAGIFASQSFVPEAEPVEGSVEVQAGASIRTEALSQNNQFLGRVVLAAPKVVNAGSIETRDGQTLLVGARNFSLMNNDAGTISSLKAANQKYNDSVIASLTVDPDLRGAQVFAGAEDFFTTRGQVAEQLVQLTPDPDPLQVRKVFLNARNAVTSDGRTFSAPLVDAPLFDPDNPAAGRGFSVVNTGLISARRGNITLRSQKLALASAASDSFEGGFQNGVLHVTTAVNANGTIFADAEAVPYVDAAVPGGALQSEAAELRLEGSSVVTMLPDLAQERDDTTAAAGDAMLGRQPTLPSDDISSAQFRRPVLRLTVAQPNATAAFQTIRDSSQSAGRLVVESVALIAAPSADVSLSSSRLIADAGTGQFSQIAVDPLTGTRSARTPIEANVLIETGAEIDVAGLSDVVLSMASNVVHIARVGALQLADEPLQKNSFLFGSEVYLDRRLTGTRADGTTWYGTPLFDASGDIDSVGRTVSELLTTGGNITLSGIVRADAGSSLNVSGGFVRYAGGIVTTTQLQTATGSAVAIGSADPGISYAGFAGSYIVSEPRWNRTKVFPSLISSRSRRYEAGYLEGGNAGSITVAGAAVLDATMHADVVAGPYQRKGAGALASSAPRAGTLDLSGLSGRPDFTLTSPADGAATPTSTFVNQQWTTQMLAAAGLADIRMGSAGSAVRIEAGAHLVLPDGGSLLLTGQDINVAGDITAHSGDVMLELRAFVPQSRTFSPDFSTVAAPRATLTLEQGAEIDLSGRWINDAGSSRETLAGTDFIDGGSFTIRSGAYTRGGFIPDFATVTLAQGSLVDLNSGGYVTPRGRLAADSNGVPLGRGGDFSVLLHPPSSTPTGENAIFDRGTLALTANAPGFVYIDPQTINLPAAERRGLIDDKIELAGAITAFGFQGGGAFTLRAPEIDIRSSDGVIGGDHGRITVPAEFLAEQGFSAYAFTGLLRAGVDAGTTVTLSQLQFVPTGSLAGATRLADVASVGSRSGTQRRAVDFTLAGLGWTDYQFIGRSSARSSVSDRALVIGEGAQILGDPGAHITLGAQGQLTLAGLVRAPGGAVTLQQVSGTSVPTNDIDQPVSFRNTSLFLAPTAEIDVDGVFVADPTQTLGRDGDVLAGGDVRLASEQLIGLTGSRILASGTRAILDLPRLSTDGLGSHVSPTVVGSDGGRIEIVSNGSGAFDTTLIARAGMEEQAGGSLSLHGPAITVTDDATSVPAGARAGEALPKVASGVAFPFATMVFSTARLAGSGVDALSLTADGVGRTSSDPERGSISFSGSPTLHLGRLLELTASNIRWLRDGALSSAEAPSGSDPYATGGVLKANDTATVRLTAPYVRFTRLAYDTSNPTPIPAPTGTRGGPVLDVSAATLDFAGRIVLFNFGRAALAADGDVRFLPGVTDAGLTSYHAGLASGGDIDITAAQVYPATGVSALIQSIAATKGAADGRITVRSNGADAPVPLSAAGRLMLSGANIVQAGVLRAPLGSIQVGVTDGDDIDVENALRDPFDLSIVFSPTASVELAAGSLTSVSAEGRLIPYGKTEQQKDWSFNDSAVTAAPAKRIAVVGADASLDDGAVLDLSGGGDVYASEFVPGLGGSRNELVTSMTQDASAAVYAIVSGIQPGVAAVDPAMQGTVPDQPGLTLTLLADIPGGLHAGTYTLLPGSYATLPGAWRVQMAGPAAADLPSGLAVAHPDGSFTVAATTGYRGAHVRSGRASGWTLMSGATWRQYSEIRATGGNAFFSRLAGADGLTAQPLPADAGRLALEVTSSLALDASSRFGIDSGGRGGQVDIAAPRITVAPAGTNAGAGSLLITPEAIRDLHAESVVLGAIRRSKSDGDWLDVKAGEVRVRTPASDPLVNPELVLVATDAVIVEVGSVVRADGKVSQSTATPLLVGRDEVPGLYPYDPPLVEGRSGDGGLIRLSTGGPAAIVHTNLPAAPAGSVVLADSVVLDGGAALSIDAAGEATIDPAATFFAANVDLASTHINVLAPDGTPGANIGRAALDGILKETETLSLRARGAVSFYDAVALRSAKGTQRLTSVLVDTPVMSGVGLAGDRVELDADTVTLTNDFSAATSTPVAASGSLAISADRLAITGGDKQVSGFGTTSLAATTAISFGDGKDTGSLTLSGDVTLDASLIVAASGGTQTLAATGSVSALNSSGAAPAATDEIGGKLVLDGRSISIDTSVAALAGVLDLRAGSGGIRLGENARLLAHGYRQAFLDHAVALSAGQMLMQADGGDITTGSGALIDVSAVAGGDAGALNVVLGGVNARFEAAAGSLRGSAEDGHTGGLFALDSAGAVDLDAMAVAADAGGFTDGFGVRSGTGDLSLSRNLRAHTVVLTADGGSVGVQAGISIDASGSSGGRIDLYGRDGVLLASGSTLLARASDATQRGGEVNIGTGDSGLLDLAVGSRIDVTGGSPYGSGGGVIHLRTPIARALDAVLDADFIRSPVVDVAGAALTPVIFEPYTRVDLGTGDVTLTGTALTALLDAFQPGTAAIEARHPGLQVQPGLELVAASGDLTIRGGAIDLSGYRYGSAGDQPGWLTLRAGGSISIDASISDGFDGATAAGELRTVSFADVAGGTLPASARSWSYRFAAGARTQSADPLAVESDTDASDLRFGDALYDPDKQYRPSATRATVPDATVPLGNNDILRTGTGSIEIAAAGDVRLLNPTSVIYTAGVGVDWTTIPDFADLPSSLTDPTLRDLPSLSRFVTDVNPALVGLAGTLPVLPTAGGDLRILAGGDVTAVQHLTDVTGKLTGRPAFLLQEARATYIGQLFSPWLSLQGAASLSADASGQFRGAGSYAPLTDATVTDDEPARQTASWVTTGTFRQGFAALGGGDLAVEAGGDVRNASFSVVSTAVGGGGLSAGQATTQHRFGGGNLRVAAGGDIASGIFYVGHGTGDIRSGGAITSGYDLPVFNGFAISGSTAVGTVLGFGDASIRVAARTTVDLGQVLSDTLVRRSALDDDRDPDSGTLRARPYPILSSYGTDNRLSVHSAGGDISLSRTVPALSTYGFVPFSGLGVDAATAVNNYLPPAVEMVAARGDLTLASDQWMALAPSPTGSLDLLAQGSVRFLFRSGDASVGNANSGALTMLDVSPQLLSNPQNPNSFLALVLGVPGRGYQLDREFVLEEPRLNRFTLHAGPTPLHQGDAEPARIVALHGDIVVGAGLASDPTPGAGVGEGGSLFLDKQAQIYAGRDIVNLTFTGENNGDADVTWIRAGRDFTYTIETLTVGSLQVSRPAGGSVVIGGPGTLELDTGRNLDLRPSQPARAADLQGDAGEAARPYGVLSVGNRINPYRAFESADVEVLFGTGIGRDIAAFIDRYIDPASAGQVDRNYLQELLEFMNARARARGEGGDLASQDALEQFRQLSEREQMPFVQQVLFEELRSIAPSADSRATVNQRRAFEAIATLFPSGDDPGGPRYTDNLASHPRRVRTGDFTMLNALLRTDYGSSISILGPGGDALIGGYTVDDRLPLNNQGIFTLRGGNIDAFLDGSFNVNNSRVLTAQGGDITIFSANGDIDAGRGKKTASFSPPITPAYTADVTSFVDFGGLITGSGIGTLVTLPGTTAGDVFLIAPRGTIDAGEAGIRASGNLVVVALQVLNAANIQVGGTTVGISQASAPPTSAALSAASSQADAGSKALDVLTTSAGGQPLAQELPSIITVEVLGFGT